MQLLGHGGDGGDGCDADTRRNQHGGGSHGDPVHPNTQGGAGSHADGNNNRGTDAAGGGVIEIVTTSGERVCMYTSHDTWHAA